MKTKSAHNAQKYGVIHFQTALFEGITEHDVAQLMASVARDDAWMYYSGAGMRSRLYRLQNVAQVFHRSL